MYKPLNNKKAEEALYEMQRATKLAQDLKKELDEIRAECTHDDITLVGTGHESMIYECNDCGEWV